LLLFWFLFAASLSVGTLVAILTDEAFDLQWFLHDALAYPLIGAVACVTVAGAQAQPHLDRVAWLFAVLGGISLAVLVVGGQALIPLPVDPWFWERFRGWSQNPNQLSELSGVLALVCIHLFDTSTRASSRVAALLCMAAALYTGILTESDSFRYALVIAVLLFIVLKLRSRLAIPWLTSFVLIAMAGALVAFASVAPIPLPSIGIQAANNIAGVLSKEGGKSASHETALRESLWRQALYRGVFDSWLLGLGPGPHLAIPAEIVEAHSETTGKNDPKNTAHPQANGTANFEAHSTILDLFTQGGLLAVGSFVWLLGAALWRAARSARFGLIALLAGICVFMITGNIVRMPIVWFGIALCLVAEPQAGLGPERGRSSSAKSGWRQPNLMPPHVEPGAPNAT
jgi:hypothetical protein